MCITATSVSPQRQYFLFIVLLIFMKKLIIKHKPKNPVNKTRFLYIVWAKFLELSPSKDVCEVSNNKLDDILSFLWGKHCIVC